MNKEKILATTILETVVKKNSADKISINDLIWPFIYIKLDNFFIVFTEFKNNIIMYFHSIIESKISR